MEPEQKLIQERLRKLEQLRNGGINPYPSKFSETAPNGELIAKHSGIRAGAKGPRVAIAGRVRAIRGHGKLSFMDVEDYSGKLQAYLRADELRDGWRVVELIDMGDFIGVEGNICRTEKGELSVLASSIVLLSKATRPLPSKWYGLRDVETRYRQRYVDLIVNPETKRVFVLRSRILDAIREFFVSEGFLEVDTPILQPIYGGTHARPFLTHHHDLDMPMYLRISNELYLKRLIVGGFERVFEFSKDFRNESMDTTHNPEFSQIESMCAYADYRDGMRFTERLVAHACRKVFGTTVFEYQGRKLDFTPPWARMTMVEAIRKHAGVDLSRVSDEHGEDARAACAKFGINVTPDMGPGAMIAEIFDKRVQPHLVQPTIIYDYPYEISPLAKRCDGNPFYVQRFEWFANGWEVGNNYTELNDPADLRLRLELQQARARKGYGEAHPLDVDFIRAIEYGMPPVFGFGLGADRLVMLLTNQASIRDVIAFPHLGPEPGMKTAPPKIAKK